MNSYSWDLKKVLKIQASVINLTTLETFLYLTDEL